MKAEVKLPLLMENQTQRKPRILCFHGFRTSGEILKKLIGRLPESVLEKLDFDFLDAPFPAGGKSDVEGIYDPPYYEWWQANEVLHLFPENTVPSIFFSPLRRRRRVLVNYNGHFLLGFYSVQEF